MPAKLPTDSISVIGISVVDGDALGEVLLAQAPASCKISSLIRTPLQPSIQKKGASKGSPKVNSLTSFRTEMPLLNGVFQINSAVLRPSGLVVTQGLGFFPAETDGLHLGVLDSINF